MNCKAHLSITTWNLGYGGLGAGSDFVVDGGRHWFPPSRRAVRENVAAITAQLSRETSDIVLLQEMAKAGPPNYWVDLKRAVDRRLLSHRAFFSADLTSRPPIAPLAVAHGLGCYCAVPVADTEIWPLPSDGDIESGWLSRRYRAMRLRVATPDGPGGWCVVNLHLAAFDTGANLRRRQAVEVLRRAALEYQNGWAVVIGGDWNMRLGETSFGHTTAPEYLTWLADFDVSMLGDGWRIACDLHTPSVRTNNRPFRAGENYTTVIDGFVISPNVAALSVEGINLGFAHSDHQPVRGRFKLRSL